MIDSEALAFALALRMWVMSVALPVASWVLLGAVLAFFFRKLGRKDMARAAALVCIAVPVVFGLLVLAVFRQMSAIGPIALDARTFIAMLAFVQGAALVGLLIFHAPPSHRQWYGVDKESARKRLSAPH
jgi:hypothetical protein